MANTLARSSIPIKIKPMLARLTRYPFDSPDYLYELKWDGIRALAFCRGGDVRFLTRNSRDITDHLPELMDLPKQIRADGVVLDGEFVCLDSEGHPNFPSLQQRIQTGRGNRINFVAFDLLYVKGNSLMRQPLHVRKTLLHEIFTPSDTAQPCEFIKNDGKAFFQATCQHGLEGIIAKEKSSLYLPGRRSNHWLKIKRIRESEFVIGGYTFGGKEKERFGSLLLGLFDSEGRLVFVGQVESGLSSAIARSLHPRLQELHVDTRPFESVSNIQRFIYWCRPELVCQVEYGEFSEEGRLRYTVFKALREDKSPEECTISDAPGWPRILADFA